MNSLNNKIKSVGVSGTHLTVELLDGRSIRLPLTLFPTLAEASARQRAKWELCGADTGIHWPLLNYDLSVAGLLRGEPEAPGIRRAKKTAKYPAHKSGKTYALAEEADGGASVPASRSLQTATRIKSSSVVDTRVVYCGDNLEQLAKLPDACVDLIYIDPPFNSNRNYEVFWGESKEKRAFEDRHESTRAYIDYMRPRCVQLARVLKKTGSFYYHCDWHASHYVKVMLDQILGENNIQSEIIWHRTQAKGLAFTGFPNNHDTIFFYGGGDEITFNRPYSPYDPDNLDEKTDEKYSLRDPDGRRYQLTSLLNPNLDRPNLEYEFLGVKRVWRWTKERMQEAYENGIVVQPSPGAVPRMKRYLDEQEGRPIDTVWTDIPPINSQAQERLGYPTQKPLALLDRIVRASSEPNDIVLDAFCGCGTALVAAQNLKRQWIGIDISPTACRVMAKRLRDVCGLPESEPLWRAGRGFIVRDLPWTEEKLRAIPPFEFENWAVIALGGIPNKVQVGDMGVDGRIYPVSSSTEPYRLKEGELGLKERWYPIQVKQKDKVGRPDIDAFEAMMMREDCEKGFFVSFDYTDDAMREADAFFRRSGKSIVLFTVQEILEEHLAKKLA
ncbi:MAG: DNA methyltransferase [Limisphaerales bacterium]